MAAYDQAVQELYQAPLSRFVAERKRLADDLRASGEREAATELLARKRPTISAWAVNQLWWHARDDFDALLATAAKLREGELAAQGAHREAIARLRQRAAAILADAGHGASEATLRRVTTTLAAVAAAGGFDPDPPGALAADREAPGFEAAGIALGAGDGHAPARAPARAGGHHDGHDGHGGHHRDGHAEDRAAQLRARAAAEAERARRAAAEAERARVRAERHRLEAALRTARGELESRERARRVAEQAVEEARGKIEELERKLAELPDTN